MKTPEDFKPPWIRRRSKQRTEGPGSNPIVLCERCNTETIALTTDEDRAFLEAHTHA